MRIFFFSLSILAMLGAAFPCCAADNLLDRLTRVSPSWEREKAWKEMEKLDDPSKQALIPGLIGKLDNPDAYVRGNAVMALGDLDMSDKNIIAALEQHKQDSDNQVKRDARVVLVRLGNSDPDLFQTLESDLRNAPDALSRRFAAQDLKFIADGSRHIDIGVAVPALAETISDDSDGAVRTEAAFALGYAGKGAAEAVPALTKALKDPDSNVRYASGWALKRIKQ